MHTKRFPYGISREMRTANDHKPTEPRESLQMEQRPAKADDGSAVRELSRAWNTSRTAGLCACD